MFPLLWASLAVADVTRTARNARSPLSNLADDPGDLVSVSVEGKPVSQCRLRDYVALSLSRMREHTSRIDFIRCVTDEKKGQK